jgi:hypothetical protein
MTVNFLRRRPVLVVAGGLALSLILGLAGCSRSGSSGGKIYAMGEAAEAGQISYTVSETQWRDQLDTDLGPRTPQNSFLLVTVTMESRGGDPTHLPLLTLIDASGKEYLEQDKGDGVPQWLGLLRTLEVGSPQSGNLLFDAPRGSYKLRISSGGDVEKEVTALVDLPYKSLTDPPRQDLQLPTPPAK